MNDFPDRLKLLRKEKNWRQSDLAQKLDITRTTVANYEQGRRFPSQKILICLADLFAVSLDYLMGRTDLKIPLDNYLSENKAEINLLLEPDNGRIISCSTNTSRFLGYSEYELNNMTLKQLFPHLTKREISNIINNTYKLNCIEIKDKDGNLQEVEITRNTIIINNYPHLLVTIREITCAKVPVLGELTDSTFKTISSMIYRYNPYKKKHGKKVSRLSSIIGRKLSLSKEKIQTLEITGLLYDIGEIYIPNEILNREGLINERERELIKSHPYYSYEILKQIKFQYPVAEIALQHHEKLDGSGYPRGLKGKDIRLEAKIIAVADTLTAMTSFRPYRYPLSLKEAFRNLSELAGNKFDKSIIMYCKKVYPSLLKKFKKEDPECHLAGD
ncbi:MAG: HD domain-containing phosphohydrolase [Bacillota bacterium]